MLNISNFALTDAQQQFVDEFAQQLLPWGLPITSARLYAYLNLAEVPVTLDEFSNSLGISKSNASVAARELESIGMARRQTDRGSKRIRYVVTDDPGLALKNHSELLGRTAGLIASRKELVATGKQLVRLAKLGEFHLALKRAIDAVIEEHR